MEAQALIAAGYVTQKNIGGDQYTCIECIISEEGRQALGRAGRTVSDITLASSRLLLV